ncbi:7791_t:CDS:2, partial [Acaulospora colombiana]
AEIGDELVFLRAGIPPLGKCGGSRTSSSVRDELRTQSWR